MATQDVLDQTVTQLTALATPSTAVADIDTQIAALFTQVAALQAQRNVLAPEGLKAKQLLQRLTQVVGRGGGGPQAQAGGLVINTPSIQAVQAAQTETVVTEAPQSIQTPST